MFTYSRPPLIIISRLISGLYKERNSGMESSLAKNIREFRKERKLTQEQLAEAMGVTTGAVYKWESGMSVPELQLLMSLADYFDVSVDRLIGYEIKDNRKEEICTRMVEYCINRDEKSLDEVEKALKRYPNSFEIVRGCAEVYLVFGIGKQDKARVKRSLELMERAMLLVPEDKDKESAKLSIVSSMSTAYTLLGEYVRSNEIMSKNNASGVFNDAIGVNLAVFQGNTVEGEKYLSQAMLQSVSQFTNTANGLAYIFGKRGDYNSARELLAIAFNLMKTLEKDSTPGFFQKTESIMLIALSYACLRSGDTKSAEKHLKEACALASKFDNMPDYSADSIRFTNISEPTFICDSLGFTAEESAEKMLEILNDSELTAMWQKEKNGNSERKRNNDK
jgi:transcriptional regulator with XRE-family HTH domain